MNSDKVAEWADRELERQAKNVFLRIGSQVIAFGHYVIAKQDQDFTVDDQTTLRTFSNGKIAASWCIADRYQQFVLAQRIYQLDQDRRRLRNDIKLRFRTAERSNNYLVRDRIMTKLESRRDFLSGIDRELDKCVEQAKYLQNQGFENETARSRHY